MSIGALTSSCIHVWLWHGVCACACAGCSCPHVRHNQTMIRHRVDRELSQQLGDIYCMVPPMALPASSAASSRTHRSSVPRHIIAPVPAHASICARARGCVPLHQRCYSCHLHEPLVCVRTDAMAHRYTCLDTCVVRTGRQCAPTSDADCVGKRP